MPPAQVGFVGLQVGLTPIKQQIPCVHVSMVVVPPASRHSVAFGIQVPLQPAALLLISTCCRTNIVRIGRVIAKSNSPARSTPSLDFFFGFFGGSPAGTEVVMGSSAGFSGGGTIRESVLGTGGTGGRAGSSGMTGGAGGSPTGGGGGSMGVALGGGCVFD
jgi:hypothetical protein